MRHLPTFDALMRLEKKGKILAWGVLKWQVTTLQSFAGRAAQERKVVKTLKGTTRQK